MCQSRNSDPKFIPPLEKDRIYSDPFLVRGIR